MAANKVMLSVVAMVLVVGAVIGAVVVFRGGNGDSDSSTKASEDSMKLVTTMCEPTQYKDACTQVLGEVAKKNASATPKDYIKAAIDATLAEVRKGINATGEARLSVPPKKPVDEEKLKSCEEYLGYSVNDLESTLNKILESDVQTLNDTTESLLSWLTAARAYQTTCVDELDDPDHKRIVENGVNNATLYTFNVQDLLWDFMNKFFDIPMPPVQQNQRRLLNELSQDGYPSWVSAADRKLLAARPAPPKPNAVVSKDGSGQFKTIGAALAAYPKNFQGRYIIYVKAGIYNEIVTVTSKQPNVFIYGDGKGKTIVTGNLNFGIMGIGTSKTATFSAIGDGFMAKSMTFRNTAGPEGHQAVALRIQSRNAVVQDCSMEGYQDTLYYHTNFQFYKNCVISGTVDFIFGSGTAVIQDSDLIVRKPLPNQSNMVTADGRMNSHETGGVVIQNCRIFPEPALAPARLQVATYLGRPWKKAARTIVMESDLGDLIKPEGFLQWQSNKPEDMNNHLTCFYREFANRGLGAPTNRRVKWPSYRVITDKNEAMQFTAGRIIEGGKWLPATGVPVNLGLIFPH